VPGHLHAGCSGDEGETHRLIDLPGQHGRGRRSLGPADPLQCCPGELTSRYRCCLTAPLPDPAPDSRATTVRRVWHLPANVRQEPAVAASRPAPAQPSTNEADGGRETLATRADNPSPQEATNGDVPGYAPPPRSPDHGTTATGAREPTIRDYLSDYTRHPPHLGIHRGGAIMDALRV
jgi:hypothetical protein